MDRGLWIEQITRAWVWRSPAVLGAPGFCSLSPGLEDRRKQCEIMLQKYFEIMEAFNIRLSGLDVIP